MKAAEANFVGFLQLPRQFIIPIYQRTYSWGPEHCIQLWNDILHVARDEKIPGHFIGSIVYIQKGIYHASSIPQLLVIDGQQRLTTLSLLLAAFSKVLKDSNEPWISSEKINNYFLFNTQETNDLRYKLLLTQTDKDTFISILEGREPPKQYSPRIVENFKFFEEQLKNSKQDLKSIYDGISKLLIVDIALDRNYDKPQQIFESLNSTGLDLSQADLIRNYVLMGLEPQEQRELYDGYWLPMEKAFGVEYTEQFNRFMRDYLTMKTGIIPNIDKVYREFKKFTNIPNNPNIKAVVSDIHHFSKYYVKLAFLTEEDEEIQRILGSINTLRVDVAYPFLLEVYEDYDNKKISKREFVEILRLVESYVFRRLICGIQTASLNKTFAILSKEINKEKYVESLKAAFQMKETYKRFPSNEEFRQQFMVREVYNLRNYKYVLEKLENYDRKELVNVDNYTIEHIMPQNEKLSTEWQAALGPTWKETQSKYLHTIGNLTLTGYNSEMSDRPFKEKREMAGGFGDSPIRLNRSLAHLQTWNEDEIKKRATELAELAIKIWPSPTIPQAILEGYVKKTEKNEEHIYSIDDHFNGRPEEIIALFQALRKRILNLDPSVREEFKKQYIAYKTTTNFVDIVPQNKRLKLVLNMTFPEVNDPKGICRDYTEKNKWGNGDVETEISSVNQLEDIMLLIRQSFNKYQENDNHL